MTRIIPDAVQSARQLPAEADVVIIGGGIIGASAALFLAEAGVRVVLCEKGIIAGEQSSRNWGWVRQMGRDLFEIPLSMRSAALWSGMNERTGEETGFRRTGVSYLCATEGEESFYQDWLDKVRDLNLDSRMLTGSEIDQQIKGIRPGYKAALYTSSDGRAEPLLAVPAIARAAARAGATVAAGCAVRSIERAAGRVSSVVTEVGEIRCQSVVLAGGAWSRLFCGNIGIDFPQLHILGSVARVTGIQGMSDMPVGGSDFSFRKRLDGTFTVALRNANIASITLDSFRLFTDFLPLLKKGWKEFHLRLGSPFLRSLTMKRSWQPDEITDFERIRILDPAPHEAFNRRGFQNLIKSFPAFAGSRVMQTWGGMIDVTPDAVPVIGAVDTLPGFYLATGFSGHGFGIGPAAGEMVADIVLERPPKVDPYPFRPERLTGFKAV